MAEEERSISNHDSPSWVPEVGSDRKLRGHLPSSAPGPELSGGTFRSLAEDGTPIPEIRTYGRDVLGRPEKIPPLLISAIGIPSSGTST
jgi:hypothetical protein